MEKECEICGTWFEAARQNAKYCPKCRKNSSKAKKKINAAIIENKKATGYWDEPVKFYCGECKKFMKMGPRRISNRIFYCSDECREKAKARQKEKAANTREQTKQYIASLSLEKRRYLGYDKGISKCPCCGKYFENPKRRVYCSDECKEKSTIKYKRFIGDITCTCKNCGKEFMIHSDKYISESDLPRACSNECRAELQKRGCMRRAEEKRNNAQAIEKANRKKLYEENGLCGYCKTSYVDCERMQTEFRVIPKGARFNNNGKIIKCPKFKEAKL